MKNDVQIGIVGTGIYLPKQVRTAKEIAEATKGVWTEDAVINKLGIRKVLYANKDEGSQEMSYLAAMDCLNNTKVDPLDIDVILSITEEYKEYPLTTSALYVQGKIGANNAWGIDLQNRCCTSVSALKIAKDMLIADPEINTIMIVGGYRNGDLVDFTDKDMSMMYNLSAGGGALILKKNYPYNQLLGSHIIGDGTLARTAGVEIGGTCRPITKDNVDEAQKSLRLLDPTLMKERLNEVSMPNWMTCIDESLRKSDLTRKDLDFLGILHIKRSGHLAMLSELGLTEDQTIYLEDYGHIGQIDQILSLHLANERNLLKTGDHVCLLAAGIGYVWAASIVRWGN
ncbi:MAG: 3-oxoacyl-ACP synthase [Bacilli bacterium]|nr:3-oxoacyl-ACP synthase [Bacilli bacterium]